jgi:endo-1,4-beta-xylanase
MLLRGHTLVWHKDLPAWLIETVNKSNVEQILQNHIQKTVKHYAGKIHSWDVVNEVISPVNTDSGYLRKSIWRDLLGADFLTMAFHFAAESDPSALLVFNEHKIDHNGNEEDRRRDFLLEILRDLKSKNVPVHALGMQAHLFFHDYLGFDFDKLRAFLASVATLGLKIIITELDVTDKEFPASPDNRDKIVASVYEDYLSCVLEEPAVIGVVTWGLSDRYTWLSERRERSDGLPIRPLPLDSNLERKHAWNAVARAFDNAPSR